METRRGPREGGLERSREAHASVEEGGKGTYFHLITHIHTCKRTCEL